jgi:hypothetical protein
LATTTKQRCGLTGPLMQRLHGTSVSVVELKNSSGDEKIYNDDE